jgi:hypothetical protein
MSAVHGLVWTAFWLVFAALIFYASVFWARLLWGAARARAMNRGLAAVAIALFVALVLTLFVKDFGGPPSVEFSDFTVPK